MSATPGISRPTGVYTALVTPFTDSGRIDFRAVPDLFDFQRSAGVDGIVVGGTNGEGVSLSVAERKRLLETALACAGPLPVIAGTGATSVADARSLTAHAARSGAAAVLVLPPFFFRDAGADGIAAYFRSVLGAADIPAILYSIPQFSGVPITPAILELLADVEPIIGVKESSGDYACSSGLIRRFSGLGLYVGSDPLYSRLLADGAAGVISGTANAFPELLVAVHRAFRAGAGVEQAQARLDEAISIVMSYPIVGNVKAVLAARGICGAGARPPLRACTKAERAEMLTKLKQADLLP